MLAQSVQSACFTRMRSGVRVSHIPHRIFPDFALQMATDIKKILKNLYEFYDLSDHTIITVGAGGGQLIGYGNKAKNVLAIDYDREALDKLRDNLIKEGLEEKFSLIYSEFSVLDLHGDVVMFEFCLHEMENPETALKHAKTMASDILVLDHIIGSEWAFIGAEEEKIEKSWCALMSLNPRKIRKFETVQIFHDYEELYQKVKPQGEISIERIQRYKEKINITIPMTYGIVLI
jgi:2-polyprenyl-3-methyl-5-hydroxy-6-metoxy-1,4-benzoquinol methylase